MANSFIRLVHLHILTITHLEWQITKEKHSPLVAIYLDAIARLSLWIWILWDGAMDQTILLLQSKFRFETISWKNTIFRQIYGYSTASTSEAVYVIGGDYTREIIAEFKSNTWRNLGSLTKARSRQASISLGDETMIIGGSSADQRYSFTLPVHLK